MSFFSSSNRFWSRCALVLNAPQERHASTITVISFFASTSPSPWLSEGVRFVLFVVVVVDATGVGLALRFGAMVATKRQEWKRGKEMEARLDSSSQRTTWTKNERHVPTPHPRGERRNSPGVVEEGRVHATPRRRKRIPGMWKGREPALAHTSRRNRPTQPDSVLLRDSSGSSGD
eukprot:scaffold338_cov361-Pavlova_lutheri.AAC.38